MSDDIKAMVQSGPDYSNLADAFIDAAISNPRRAEEILAAHPEIVDAGFYVDLVLGHSERIRKALTDQPELAIRPSGPRNIEPLLYVCFSRFAHGKPGRAGDFAETARVLLRHGANPDAVLIPEHLPDNPLSCLYAATGLNNNPALAQALLEAGANPNDSESLYHSTEHSDLACMKLLLQYGATPAGANALKHLLDREDLEGLQLLLAAGADPNERNGRGETALHWAVSRGRSAAAVAALIDSGADLDIQREDGRTAFALAFRSGQTEVAGVLEARGARTELPEADRILGACLAGTGGAAELHSLLSGHPEVACLLSYLAMIRQTAAVKALLASGMPVDARGEHGGTALHWACWKGYPDVAELLLAHGASLTIEDRQFHATPPGWFGHGVRNCNGPDGDYPRVARLLIAAGATIPSEYLPTSNPDVDAVLREHGVI